MRRVSILTVLVVPLLIACNRQMMEPSPEATGSVRISLDASERVDLISVKSDPEAVVPDKGDFWIEIFNYQKVKFFKEKYADVEGRTIGMNIGDFTLVARHGDSLGVGFDKPFYMAKTAFSVVPAQENLIQAVAKLANVKVAVSYNEHLQTGYSNYYAVLEHADYKGKNLTFSKDETRAGYIPKGRMTLKVYAEVNGELKCHTPKDGNGDPKVFTFDANDFVTFNIKAGEVHGNLIFGIRIDDGTELREQSFEVPADAFSDTKPSIVLSSCDENGVYYITEGIVGAPADLGFTYKAYSGIKTCSMTVESEYLAGLGVPQTVDVKNMDAATRASLEEIGFFFAESAGVGVVGFEDIVHEYSRTAAYLGGGKPTDVMTVTLSLEDNDGNTVSRTVKVQVQPEGAASIVLNDYDVWATKVIDPVVTVTKGNTSLMMVESSLDGNNWSDFMQVTSADFHMGTITGLTPSTKYYLRVVYDDWMVISNVLSLTTEAAQQVGNAGFEEFQCVDFLYTPQAGSQRAEPWYLPWNDASTAWWDVNSKRTLRKSPTVAYQNYKCYPTVSYINSGAHGGGKSAQIASVATGQTASEIASGTSYPGELFIGKSNDQHQDDWGYASTGHSFSSRPSKVRFWYQFEEYDGESFYVGAEVRDAAGNVIAKAERTSSAGVSSWTEMTMDLNYSNTAVKAASIFMTFRSSTKSHPSVRKRKLTYYNSDDDNHYIGTVLRVDDVELLY